GRWRFFVSMFLDCKRKYPEKYYILRYEDLASAPETTFKSLSDFLGIAYDPSVFDFHKKKEEVSAIYSNTIWDKFHDNLLKPVNTGRMNTWQGKLTSEEVRMADMIAGKYADKLGYERQKNGFNLWLFLKACPMLTYNYILLTMMILGSYLPAKTSQWFFFKATFLLKVYLKIVGKKPASTL
ncbi:MAG: sulfotransferase domain-containing protein, partial [Bacteroidota bacterium]